MLESLSAILTENDGKSATTRYLYNPNLRRTVTLSHHRSYVPSLDDFCLTVVVSTLNFPRRWVIEAHQPHKLLSF
jgi:hypothetical protein